jgi:hypothetical protein
VRVLTHRETRAHWSSDETPTPGLDPIGCPPPTALDWNPYQLEVTDGRWVSGRSMTPFGGLRTRDDGWWVVHCRKKTAMRSSRGRRANSSGVRSLTMEFSHASDFLSRPFFHRDSLRYSVLMSDRSSIVSMCSLHLHASAKISKSNCGQKSLPGHVASFGEVSFSYWIFWMMELFRRFWSIMHCWRASSRHVRIVIHAS